MLISNIINDSFGRLSKQLRFYCWHFRRNLDQRQRQELLDLLYKQHFDSLANKIKSINENTAIDSRQQVGKLLFEHCFTRNRRHQLIQLIQSELVDIDVRLDNYGRTLLHRSVYNLDVELVKILIEYGVNIRLRDYAGNTALHIAIQSYRNGAVIYANDDDSSVVQNLTSILKLLLEADRNLQNERSKRKRRKLHNDDGNDDINTNHAIDYNNNINQNNNNSKHDDSNEQEMARDVNLATLLKGNECCKRKGNDSSLSQNNSNNKIGIKKAEEGSKEIAAEKNNTYSKDSSSSEAKFTTAQQQQQQSVQQTSEDLTEHIDPLLLEDASSPLVDTKNAFGRTALHYCVLVVGEQHLAKFVKLLITFGADTDATDTKMRTPLYCLVKRPGVSAIREKCQAIQNLLDTGCDDLGLAIDKKSYFTEEFLINLEKNISTILKFETLSCVEPIFKSTKFSRVPSLKHITRLNLIKNYDEKLKLGRQTKIVLPEIAPSSLNLYLNRKILDQSELF